MTDRPNKPYPDYPLFAHASGRWAKKIKGKLHYFGYWSKGVSWQQALDQFIAERDYLFLGS